MMRFSMRPMLLPAFVVVCAATACGKSSPTDPTTGGPADVNPGGPTSYAGSVALTGRTGILVINTAGSVAWRPRPDALAVLLDLIEPRVLAQGSTASGTLALDDGTTIWLTGSGAGGNLQLSGSDGYSVAASIATGVLSGTVTAPTGSGTVGPLVPVNTLNPEPGDPNGGFEATYTMTTGGYFRNINTTTGRIDRNCGYTGEVTGTLRLDVLGHPQGSRGGFRHMEFRSRWRQTETILPPCPLVPSFSPRITEETEGDFLQILSRKANDVHQFAVQHKFTNPTNGATVTRVFAFVGAYTSETAIPGTVVWMANSTTPTNTGQHLAGFAPTQTAVTFQKVSKCPPERCGGPSSAGR